MTLKKIVTVALILGILGTILVYGVHRFIVQSTRNIISSKETVGEAHTTLILGSLVYKNGNPSDVFRDRLDCGVFLYKNRKTQKLLVSGDNGSTTYNEVEAARKYLIDQGIPASDIFLDHAGFDTYDSIFRARDVFNVKDMIICTQAFHLPRSLFIAQKLGIPAHGALSDTQHYIKADYWQWRELAAQMKAFVNIYTHAQPTYLGPQIPINGDGTVTQ